LVSDGGGEVMTRMSGIHRRRKVVGFIVVIGRHG